MFTVFVDNLLHVFRAKTEARLLPPPFVVVRYDKFEGLLVAVQQIVLAVSYLFVGLVFQSSKAKFLYLPHLKIQSLLQQWKNLILFKIPLDILLNLPLQFGNMQAMDDVQYLKHLAPAYLQLETVQARQHSLHKLRLYRRICTLKFLGISSTPSSVWSSSACKLMCLKMMFLCAG